MEWQGLLGFFFLFFVLAGFVYIGANTDKLTSFDFGGPSAISKEFTPPSSDLPSFSFPSISVDSFFSGSGINLDKIQTDLERKLMNAKSEQEVKQIIEDTIRPILADPRMESDCKRVMKELESERVKMGQWVSSGKNYQLYPIENAQQLAKEFQICALAESEGYIDLSP